MRSSLFVEDKAFAAKLVLVLTDGAVIFLTSNVKGEDRSGVAIILENNLKPPLTGGFFHF
jgi:hypothetical protein